MAQSKDHFQEFQPHSLLKHAVLKAYLEAWARKMLLRPNAGTRLHVVDACAGAGRDTQGNPGSPMLAVEVALNAENHLQGDTRFRKKLTGRPRIELTAIEKDTRRFRELATNLAPYSDRTAVVCGTLAEHIEEHFRRHKDTPTLFFVDPFGLAPLRADVIRRALSGPRNEVLLLFADQAALRHFGAATAVAPSLDAEITAKMPSQRSLFEDAKAEDARIRAEVAARVRATTQAQALTRPAAVTILNAAYGGDYWLPVIEATRRPERRAGFIQLYIDMLHRFGAHRVLRLPMRNDQDRHVYTLLHATQSVHGYMTMKEVVNAALNKPPLSAEAIESMRFEILSDLDEVEVAVRQRFAGQTVAWSNRDLGGVTIKGFVLEETEVFPFELRELKNRFKEEKASGPGPQMYSFPPALTK